MKAPIIMKLAGTNGSGKSTVVHTLLQQYKWEALSTTAKGDPDDYLIKIPGKRRLVVLGRYTTQCGGCDGIQPYAEIVRRVWQYAATDHHIFMEGLLISGYGSLGKAFDQMPERRIIYAAMDTPLEECVRRVLARRKAKGNDKPFNRGNLDFKWLAVRRSMEMLAGIDKETLWVDHKRAVEQVLGIYK